jgi:hypothetical protein
MEEKIRLLTLALGPKIGVYLGPEHLTEERELPHVIAVPVADDFSASASGGKTALAQVDESIDFICRAGTYTDVRTLARLVLQEMSKQGAKVEGTRAKYGSEPWGHGYARSATITVTFPATFRPVVNILAHVETITQHIRELNLITVTQQEAPDGLSGQSTAVVTTTFEG